MRTRRKTGHACALPIVVAATFVAGLAPAGAAAKSSAAGKLHYARVEQVCPAPAPGYASCFAMVSRPVASSQAGRPGVRAYTLPGGGAASAGPAGGLTPSDLAGAYGYDPASGGEGQTVAIVDAYNDPNIASDLNEFDTHYGLGECTEANGCFKKVGQTGKTNSLPVADPEGWSVEISLDVEAVRASCRKCKILLVESENPSDANLGAAVAKAVELGATAVSNSYGGYEGGPEETADYNQPGVLITAATGDEGWASWVRWDEGLAPPSPAAPNTPSSFPTVVAVGGTTLHLTAAEKRASETVWNGNGLLDSSEFIEGASGGGCSILFAAPVWQQDAPGYPATGCAGKRSAADVAAVADPVTGFDIFDTYNCGIDCERFKGGSNWSRIGGTSLATPLITGMWALAGGAQGVRYPASTLYGHLGDSSAAFDVTTGGNGWCDEGGKACGINALLAKEGLGAFRLDCEGTTECNATGGFDGPTGVGSPNSLSIFKPVAPTAEEEAAAKRKAEEEAAAKHRAEEEAAAKHRAEEEAARKGPGTGPVTGGVGGGGGPGGGGVASFRSATPAATLAGTSVKAAANGLFTLKVSCPAGASSCEGTITVQSSGAVPARARAVTLASAVFKVAGGRSVLVKLHLSARARKLLARRRLLRVRVNIASHDASGQTGATHAVATIRAARSHG